MRLVDRLSYTRTYTLLMSAASQHGIVVENTARVSRQQIQLQALKLRGWVEIRNSGPKGGKFYHITDKGKTAIRCADLALACERIATAASNPNNGESNRESLHRNM